MSQLLRINIIFREYSRNKTRCVVQGMAFDPILFIIYTNGIFNLKISSEIISNAYADHTIVLIEGNNNN